MKVKSKKKSRTRLLHQYYSYTGFYAFLGKSLKKSANPIILIVGLRFFVNEYVVTIDGTKQIKVKINGVESWVMMDTSNTHYQQILKWVEEGNTIEEAD